SMRSTPSLVTRYCFPPVAITAYIGLRETGGLRKAAHSTGALPAGQTPDPPFSAAPLSDRMRGCTRGPSANDIGRNPRACPIGPRLRRSGDPGAAEERRP